MTALQQLQKLLVEEDQFQDDWDLGYFSALRLAMQLIVKDQKEHAGEPLGWEADQSTWETD